MVKKTLLIVLAVLVVLVGAFAAVVAMQPTDFHIERTALMSAAPSAVFAQVNDFHKWDAWSPWLKIDPNAKTSFEGPSQGEGAIFRWAGNADVGEGSMTITESRPSDLIKIDLHFLKPFEDTAATQFTFKPEGDQTAVTWSMDGKNTFVSKAFCMFMDMDAMIGGKYEEGLASIKAIVEAEPKGGETHAAESTAPSETDPAGKPDASREAPPAPASDSAS